MTPKSISFEYVSALVLAAAVLIFVTLLATGPTSPNASQIDAIYQPQLLLVY
jgi:hypothetical protein